MDRRIKTGITIKHILIFVSLLLLLVSVNSGSVYARTTPYENGEVCPVPCPECGEIIFSFDEHLCKAAPL